MADWNTPITTTAYTSVLTILKDRDFDAISLCYNLPTNLQTGMMRYVRASNKFQEYVTSAWVDKVLSVAGGGTGATTAADARTALGIGTLGVQNSNSISVTGGTITGVNLNGSNISSGTVALARGGTGSSLSIGSEGQVLGVSSGAIAFLSVSTEATGVVKAFAGETIPTGYLLCDGSAISRTTYAALFAAIGTTWGAGNGTTTFNIPDGRDKVIYGVSATVALGTAVGAATHVHTLNSHVHDLGSHVHTLNSHIHTIANHTHTVANHTHTGPAHVHTVSAHTHTWSATSGGPSAIVSVNTNDPDIQVATSTHTHNSSGTTSSGGSGNTGSEGTGATSSSGSGNTGSNGSGNTGAASGNTSAATGNTGAAAGDTGSGSTLQPGIAMNYIIKI